jgi:predicted  nucleic acid-binding Zn-ribbon protein
MSTRAAALYALQGVDLQMDALRRRLAEIQAALNQSGPVSQARAALAAAEATLHHSQTAQRTLELEIAGLAEKMTETEALLYSGRVRNPKELSDLQAELAALGRQRSAREDALLEAMVNVEDHTAAVGAARSTLAGVEAATLASQAELRAEAARIEENLKALTDERDMQLMSVSAADFAAYEALRWRKGGAAVALLEYNTCGVCGATPSSSRLQQARLSEDLIACDNCERILYAP